MVSNGIDFLGYIIRPGYILVRNRVVNNLKTKLKNFKGKKEARENMIASYKGHCRFANAYRLMNKFWGWINVKKIRRHGNLG